MGTPYMGGGSDQPLLEGAQPPQAGTLAVQPGHHLQPVLQQGEDVERSPALPGSFNPCQGGSYKTNQCRLCTASSYLGL